MDRIWYDVIMPIYGHIKFVLPKINCDSLGAIALRRAWLLFSYVILFQGLGTIIINTLAEYGVPALVLPYRPIYSNIINIYSIRSLMRWIMFLDALIDVCMLHSTSIYDLEWVSWNKTWSFFIHVGLTFQKVFSHLPVCRFKLTHVSYLKLRYMSENPLAHGFQNNTYMLTRTSILYTNK